MKRVFFVKILVLITLPLLAACGPARGTDEQSRFPVQAPGGEPASPAYLVLRQAVLAPHCLRCHSRFGTEKGLLGSGLLRKGQPEASEIFIKVSTGEMPEDSPKLGAELIETLRRYILEVGP